MQEVLGGDVERKYGTLEREQVVKDIYNQNKNDPRLYLAIKYLAEGILATKTDLDRPEIDRITHDLASDMFHRVVNEGLEVEKWTIFVWKTLLGYRKEYFKFRKGTSFELDDVVERSNFREMMYSGSYSLAREVSAVETNDFIYSLPEKVKQLYEKFVRFSPSYKYYDSLYVSVLGSLIRGEVLLFRLPDHFYSYVSFLCRLINQKLADYISYYLDESNFLFGFDKRVSVPFDSFEEYGR